MFLNPLQIIQRDMFIGIDQSFIKSYKINEQKNMKDLLDMKIEKLKEAGFELNCDENNVWYERNGKKIPSTMIVGCSFKDIDTIIKTTKDDE